MYSVFEQINRKLGVPELPGAMFYDCRYALRFELGGELHPKRSIRRFMQAHGRALAISEALFRNSAEVFVFLSSYGPSKPRLKRLRPFQYTGLKRSAFTYVAKTAQRDDDYTSEPKTALFRHWDVAKVESSNTIPEILWLGIASDIGVKPCFRSTGSAYLVDATNGLALHVYDDRGMDVAAVTARPLKELFDTYNDWLLPYDLARMTDMFGDNPS